MTNTNAATGRTILAEMEQVAYWLPKRESGRNALIRSVAEMKQRLEGEPLSKGEVVNFQMQVWRLSPNRFKTLLNRRVAQFGALYGVDVLNAARQGVRSDTPPPTMASGLLR